MRRRHAREPFSLLAQSMPFFVVKMLLFRSYTVLSYSVPTAGELLVMARDLYDETFGPPEDVRHVRLT